MTAIVLLRLTTLEYSLVMELNLDSSIAVHQLAYGFDISGPVRLLSLTAEF